MMALFGTPSGGEVLIILVIILLLFGSKNLPKMARTLGRTLEEFRRAARDVSDEIMRAGEDETPARPKLSGAVPREEGDDEVEQDSAKDPAAKSTSEKSS